MWIDTEKLRFDDYHPDMFSEDELVKSSSAVMKNGAMNYKRSLRLLTKRLKQLKPKRA